MANTLMFEVGIKRANEEYNKILEEVKALAKMADNSISLKVQLEKSNDLKTFLDALKQLGDGKMLEPLLHKIDNLQASMVRLGMIPKDIDYSNLEKQLQKVTVAYENYQKAREKAGLKEGQADVTGPTMALGQVYRTARANLEKEFGLSENVARATMDTFKNMGNTIQENMARIGGSKAGMESLSGEVGGLTTKVDALVNAFSSLVSQLKSLGTGSGVKDMATDVAKVDEGTSKMAQALAKAFGNLNEKKADVKVSEDSLATATNTAAAALKAEEAQAGATAASILRVADSISVATLATKNLYTILGGNREDIAKFLELANTMDMLSRKSAYIMNSGESFSGGKMGAFTEVKKEMEAVQAQMDELKKSGLSGSPIIDSFATAFKNLSEVLTAAGTSVKESTKNLKSLGEGAKNLEKISESQERANRAKNQTTESIEKETQARKKGAAAANDTSSAEDKAASAANANAEAIQKLLTATQELTTATNNLKMAIGSWGQDKGTIATMVAQFEELRKKITQVVEQWEKLAMVKATGVQNVQVPSFNIDLSSIEPTIKTLNEAVAQLKKSMDLLWESTNRMESSLKAIVTPETFKKVESDAASAKQKVDELSKSVEGMKMQSEKKGSETTLNANLDVLKNHTKNVYEALTQIAVEYEKLSNQKLRDDGLEQRLLKLREYYEWLQKVATMTDTLSKPGALKADATKFNGELLMGKQTKEMWSDKAVKDFQKIVEEILSGRRAAESFETAIQKLKERVEEFNSTGSKGFGGVGAAMETINRVGELNIQTLIKEQGHIERMMKLAEGSSKYMEGHKVAGMDKLQAVQDSNMNYLQTLNRWISLILQNRDNPDIIRFLNTPQSLKLPLPGRADDVAMFNAHYDKLKHSITDTSAAARQLVKDMSLTDANASIKQWNTTRLETGLYNVQDAIQGIMRAWRNASQYADEDMTKAVAQQINRLNAIKQEILTAMTNEQLLSTRHGYASVINPDNTHTLKDSKQMVTDLNAFTRERIKAEKEYNKEVERFTNQSKKEAARQEQEYQKNVERWQESQMKDFAKAEQEKAKAAQQAQKDIQREIQKTEAEMRKLDSAISRGNATPGRDMTLLSDARSKLQGQLSLLQKTTPADLQNSKLIEKRIQDIRTLRDDTDALRKSEERLTTAQQQSNRRSDRVDDKRLKDEIKSVNDAYVKYNELGAKLNELQSLRARGITANVDVSGLDRYIEYLEKVRQLMKEIYSNNGRTSNSATVQDFGIRQGMLASEALAHNNVKSSSFYNKNNLSQFTQDLRDAESRMKAAQRTAENLGNRIDKLNLVKVDFAKAGIDTTPLQNAIDKIRAIQQELANFGRTGFSSYGTSGKEIASNMGLNAANKAATDSIKKLTTEQRESANAANKMTIEQERLANALNKTSESAKGQSQVLSDLKMMAMQYLSVWGAQSFFDSIIQTGGQLEQQRLSLSAILGDMEKATTLFGQIKELAIKSPFGVVELDKMTKQLAAYSFEADELFDWTKRLADISAATGTSVDRLALALGHVRSEGALSGYTLRQFSMANVPVLRMLSENLGISSKEVRDRVRKKEISADDVQEILRQLTSEGGMFYNAQEVMSQALNAKFKNLHDAFDIMYGEIAESGVGDILKDLATTLTAGAKEWERFGRDVIFVGTAFGISRVAITLYNRALGEGTISALKSVAVAQQQENANYRLARAAGLVTKAEYEQLIYNERYSVSGLKVALTTQKLTIEELQRAVALGKVNKQVAQAAVVAAGYDAALISNVRVLGFWRKGVFLLSEGFRAAAGAVRGFFAAAWPLMALSAVFELVSRNIQQNDVAKESAESAAKATNKYQDLQAMVERVGTSHGKNSDQLEKNIDAMKESLKAVGEYTDELKKQVDSVDTLAQKYDLLHEAMKRVAEDASGKQERKQNLLAEGLSTGSGTSWNPLNWFRDNALKDAKDIDDYAKNLYLAIDQNSRILNEAFSKYLKDSKKWKKEFEGMSAKDIFMSLDSYEQNAMLSDIYRNEKQRSNLKDAIGSIRDVMYGSETGIVGNAWKYSYAGALNELRGHSKELSKAFADAFHVDYPEIDLSKANEEQKIIFAKWLDDTINNLQDVKADGKKALNDIVIEGTIKVRPFYTLENDNWEKFLQDFQEKNPIGYAEWNKHSRNGVSSIEQQRKDAESYGRTFSGMSQTSLGNDSKKRIKELDKERERRVAFQKSIMYKDNADLRKENDERIAAIDIEKKRLQQAQKDYNQQGDPDKNKGGNKEDPNAKAVREKVRVMKEAADAFTYWREKVGEKGAWSHVQQEFGEVLKQIGITAENIQDLKGNLNGSLNSKEFKAIKDKKVKTEIQKEIAKENDQLNRKDFERTAEDFASKVQIELDSLTRSWEIFNSVRESTGNVELAVQLSGVGNNGTRNLADDIRKKVERDFASSGVSAIPFNINFDDKDIERQVMDAFNKNAPKQNEGESDKEYAARLTAYQSKIKGVVEEYKKWRDLQRDVFKSDVAAFTQLLGSAQDYETSIAKINYNLSKQKESIDNLEKPDGISDDDWTKIKDHAKGIADAKAQSDIFKLSAQYINLMNNAAAMTGKEIREAAKAVEIDLNRQLQESVINAQTFANKMEKVHKIVRDSNLNSFFGNNSAWNGFAKGGVNGAVEWLDKSINKRITELGKDYTTDKNGKYNGNDKTLIDLLDKRETWEGVQKSLSGVALACEIVTGAFDGMVQATQSLAEMFYALGNEGAGNTWSDISDGIKAGSSFLAPVNNIVQNAMSGNISGIVSSAISAPVELITGPITGFAKLHDKKRERQIEALRRDVQQVDNTLNLIRTLRERTLGYDKGDMRRLLAAQYKNNNSASGKAMYEFYTRGGISANGYSQELASMKKQRQDYIDMYNAENDKKDSSASAMAEYQSKIAELDEEIMFFTQDLANTLWGIDIKSWANQISDALWNAFENGENAVKAFEKTAKDIVASVAKEMMKLGFIEPLMQNLQKQLFGTWNESLEMYEGGAIKYTKDKNGNIGIDMQGSEKAVLKVLGSFYGQSEEFAKAGETFYNWVERATGIRFSDNDSALSGNIKGITEDTADLLASYINAIRADVAMNRAFIAMFIQEYWISYVEQITSVHTTLRNIDRNVAAMALTLSETGKIYGLIENISSRLDKFANGVDKISVQ